MYLIGASAAELLEWCDVPRTKEDYMAGYQRVLSEGRADDIASYLAEDPKNILPGAIIVATDAEYISVEEATDGHYYINVSEDTRTDRQKIEELWGHFTTRLSEVELQSANIGTSEISEEDEETDEDEYPTSYLAKLAAELTTAITEWSDLPEQRRNAILDYINGVSKPGLIIDGQHRVIGAKNVSKNDVVLPVVVMHNLPYSEQVFQFYVLNSKARPLRPTELRRIISTSLTDSEIDDLFERFRSTKVDAEEARRTFQMNTSPKSVFRELINFGFETTGAVIPENVADQLMRKFMNMPRKRYAQLIVPVSGRWDNLDERMEMFFDFWRAVSQVYSNAWSNAVKLAKESNQQAQIFRKVALLTLQTFILDRFVTALPYRKGNAPPFSSEAATREMVESTLANLPEKFFIQEWQLTQLDTSVGREELLRTMSDVWEKAGKDMGRHKLFKKKA
jgi:DGQHR domain-containing protein